MRIASTLACAAGLSLAACGQDPEPFPPSGATATAWCTKTAAGTLASCLVLQTSVPGNSGWVLETLRNFKVDPGIEDRAPVEVSMFFHLTVRREESPVAP
jgi:hypothetical protein